MNKESKVNDARDDALHRVAHLNTLDALFFFFIRLLDSLKKNAEQKGLNSDDLVVSVAMANKGPTRMRQGRHRGQMKNTHILLCAQEQETKKEKKKT